MDTKIIQPSISVQGDEVLIRIPRFLFDQKIDENGNMAKTGSERKPRVDFSRFVGILADVPEFKSKTSVEVEDMIYQPFIHPSSIIPNSSIISFFKSYKILYD